MDLKYIIHPQTNKKIDLFSIDGLTILNQYITIFKFGGDGNFKLGYRTSRRHDKLYKIDKTLGRFHNITEKRKGKKGKVYRNCKYLNNLICFLKLLVFLGLAMSFTLPFLTFYLRFHLFIR